MHTNVNQVLALVMEVSSDVHVSFVFITLSTVITFSLLLLMVRWIGSTQLTQLTFFNWVAGASMGNVAANMLTSTNKSTWLSDCYALILFSGISVLAAFIAIKSRQFRRVTNGEPTVIIHHGAILRENLRRTQVNLDVLMMLLREKGYFSYSDIEFAILEPTGNLSILPTPESQSVSKADLAHGPDLSERGQGPYIELVVDGEIDEDKLKETNHTRQWIMDEIRKRGGNGLEEVTYLAVNRENEIVVDMHRKDGADEPDPLV